MGGGFCRPPEKVKKDFFTVVKVFLNDVTCIVEINVGLRLLQTTMYQYLLGE